MPTTKLPARPSLEYLRKLAKDRLADMRRTNPDTQLAVALLAVARDHGFSSWRALKADLEQRHANEVDRFFRACKEGDIVSVETLLREQPALVDARDHHHATGLYFAATAGHCDLVSALIDAGADPHDVNDVNRLGVIGWVTRFPEPDKISRDVLALLAERGVQHHIFSAIALGDADVIRRLVEKNPAALDERMSRHDHRQTPLHLTVTRQRTDLLKELIALGADVEAVDGNGQTPIEYAAIRGDHAAVEVLLAAGARKPEVPPAAITQTLQARLAASVQKSVPILGVRDIAATLGWYTSIGFTELGRYPQDGTALFWGMVSFGRAELMFERGESDPKGITVLVVTKGIEELCHVLTRRAIRFVESLHEPIFGGLQFSVEDPNGCILRFLQESEQEESLRV